MRSCSPCSPVITDLIIARGDTYYVQAYKRTDKKNRQCRHDEIGAGRQKRHSKQSTGTERSHGTAKMGVGIAHSTHRLHNNGISSVEAITGTEATHQLEIANNADTASTMNTHLDVYL